MRTERGRLSRPVPNVINIIAWVTSKWSFVALVRRHASMSRSGAIVGRRAGCESVPRSVLCYVPQGSMHQKCIKEKGTFLFLVIGVAL